MKKNLCYFILFLIGSIWAFTGVRVSAETMQEKYQAIPDVYIWKKDLTGHRVTKSHQMTMIVKNSNNQFVYCIEPGTPIDGTHMYTGFDTNQDYVANMSVDEWKRIELLAYYGYQYKDETVDHSDIKWYAVAQYMIWKTVPHGYDIYFSTSVYENNRIEKFTEEQQEMEDLISKHYLTPDFDSNLTMLLGEKKTLQDKNKVLEKFQFTNRSSIIETRKNGNVLEIKANEIGNVHLDFEKMDSTFSHAPIVYVHPESQDVLEVGSYTPVKSSYDIKVVGASLELTKLDKDTKSCNAKLKGAVYGLYKKDGTFLANLTIGSDCTAKTEKFLAMGDYYLEELESPTPYLIDTTKHTFSITEENTFVAKSITLYDKQVLGGIKIQKKNERNEPLKGIQFQVIANEDIYDVNQTKLYSKGDIVALLTTDEEGNAIIDHLPLGHYLVKESLTLDGYELSNEVYLIHLKYEDELTPVVYENLSIINYSIPKTKKNDYTYYSILFTELGGFLLYDKKRFGNHSPIF